ncbi:MAG TPA: glycoside hydrolase family 15 protein, partial [Polyangiaceae bacterium LLY-WYZ-15_(1-7)]|nr:glycoside hydrolase family 15 protein [Polyangiaceae bacterium LLY-WYZ-15_(1-7)]
MDLYSAAKRLNRPFRFERRDPHLTMPIGAHGLIGDGFSSALVRADGAIDWLCLPRFDSPSVFGALLDPAEGGITAVTPAARPFSSFQRYDPDTNVLETLFQVDGQGVVRITDYMPWTDDPRSAVHEVHRRIQCVEGMVELDVVFDPRFDYGRDVPSVAVMEHGVLARGAGGETLAGVLGGQPTWEARDEGGVRARVRLRGGERRWMVITWGAPRPEPVTAYRPFEHLRATRNAWRTWVHQLGYEGPWRHHVIRSALVLKALLYAPTGAMVAAPTTSLPEWIGGTRNWDYRYSWTRDSAMAIRAANLLGAGREAREFFHFVRDTLESDLTLQIMYDLDGRPVPVEEELSHLAGYRGSTPVRIGNGARDQVQLDTAGALLDAAFVYERGGGSLTLRAWRSLREVVEGVQRRWREPDHGIWEPRDGKRHNVHSKLMSWVALRRGADLAPLFGAEEVRDAWQRAAEEVHADICAHGHDARKGHFVAAYGHDHADAALLLMPITGFLGPQDPRAERTIAWLRSELGDGPFIHRYKTDDGVGGPEGAFILCGFWLP